MQKNTPQEEEERKRLYAEFRGRNAMGVGSDNPNYRKGYNQRTDEINKKNSSSGSSCWIVTAYYEDAEHIEVIKLRKYRDKLIENSKISILIKYINFIYHIIGKSLIGKWWVKCLQNKVYSATKISEFLISKFQKFERAKKFLKR